MQFAFYDDDYHSPNNSPDCECTPLTPVTTHSSAALPVQQRVRVGQQQQLLWLPVSLSLNSLRIGYSISSCCYLNAQQLRDYN